MIRAPIQNLLSQTVHTHLIQVFVPLAGGDGKRFSRSHFEAVEDKLVAEFTGFTSYPRAPANGLWKGPDAEFKQDDLIIYEIMTDNVDDDWWKSFRQSLEELFQQDKILIRSDRLDLSDTHAKLAKEMGVKIAVNTDAHSIEELDFISAGLNQARRGWIEPKDVLNTLSIAKLRTQLQR